MTTDACIKALEDIAKIKLRAAEGAAKLSEEGTSMGKPDIGGVKFDDGKPDYTLVPWPFLCRDEKWEFIQPFYRWWRGRISADRCALEVMAAYAEYYEFDFVDLLSQSLNYGATKYEAWNWEKGISRKRLYAAVCRHFKAIYDHGLDATDKESGLPHLAHLAFYAVAIYQATD